MLPQLLLLKGGGSHADQPSCEQMARSSPLSPSFDRAALHANRTTLLWFGGHEGHGDARTRLFRTHSGQRGFELHNSLRSRLRRNAINMSLASAFCWVPRGQGQGDPTRHMVSLFHGCVPVFTLGVRKDDDALPFDELLPWHRFSLRVPVDELGSLPAVLEAAARDDATLRSMQSELGCVWRSLFWTSLQGSCFGETPRGDAFDALMAVLRLRLTRRGMPPMRSTCALTARPGAARNTLPPHLPRAAPGARLSGVLGQLHPSASAA